METRNIEEEPRRKEEFYKEHGYPPNIGDQVIHFLKYEDISEEGLSELWKWYNKELDKGMYAHLRHKAEVLNKAAEDLLPHI